MIYNEVATVLGDLRATTRHLNPEAGTKRFDLDHVEQAVADREHSVARLRQLTLQHPEAFTFEDLEELQRILAEGKQASENLLDMRRHAWTTATELRKKGFILKTFVRYGS
jgi:hypothetical protein